MNRRDLQQLSSLRKREAKVLLNAGLYDGAYYLAGYSVENALKACIAKKTAKHDFPDKQLAIKSYTHNLEELLSLAGFRAELERDMRTNKALELNWAIVKDWSEQSRYGRGRTKIMAEDMYSACTARGSGILAWIKTRW